MQSPTAATAKPSTIILAGGGSGGHITPLLAVAASLRKLQPDLKIVHVGSHGDRLGDIAGQHVAIDSSYQIFAGKLRRYHTEGWKQLLDIVTLLKNLRDLFYVGLGFWQAIYLLVRLKPSVVFVKGSLLSVPVGLAAAILGVPYVTHDSDSIPGLANRIVARWATAHAVAMPKELYPYNPEKTFTVGIPLQAEFKKVTPDLMKQYRRELHIPDDGQVIFVVGGGLGAVRLNQAVTNIAEQLLLEFPRLHILHGTGRGNEGSVQSAYNLMPEDLRRRIKIKDFINDIYRWGGAADLVITRGGATNLAEFAAQGKACIVVPNPLLAGGHQLKNAEHLNNMGAIVEVSEAKLKQDAQALLSAVRELLQNPAKREALGQKLNALTQPDAAGRLAELLISSRRK